MKAGAIAAPFITANRRWCEVDWITFESKAVKGVHVLGDSLQIAPAMPKSGSMANGHGKVCAAAVVALLNNEAPNPSPTLINTCYSMVSDKLAIHVTSVHKYDEKRPHLQGGAGLGRRLLGDERGRGRLHHELGAQHLGRRAALSAAHPRRAPARRRIEAMTRRILVLFPDEWDRAAARDPRYRGTLRVPLRGLRPLQLPRQRAALHLRRARVRRAHGAPLRRPRHRRGGHLRRAVRAVPRLARGRAPGPAAHAARARSSRIQHKYYARQAFERIAARGQRALRPDPARLRREAAEDVPMPFPFYVKPAKAAFSVLARRVDSFEELYRAHALRLVRARDHRAAGAARSPT